MHPDPRRHERHRTTSHHTHDRRRTMRSIAGLGLVAVLVVACGSGTKQSSPAATTGPATSVAASVAPSTALSTAAATTQPAAPPVDKSGAPTDQKITLTLATQEPQQRPGGKAVKAFVDAVAKRSGGAITITPKFDIGGQSATSDQDPIEAVRKGDYDLVYSRAGAFESEGVGTVSPLQLPGVVTTDAQADKVSTSDAAAKVLAGLSSADLVGLALFPENLRHPALWNGKAASTTAFAGVKFRAPLQGTVFDVLTALGASPVAVSPTDFDAGVKDGTITGFDPSLNLTDLIHEGPNGLPTVTSNVTLYDKFGVLGLSSARARQLTPDQLSLLRQAAADAVASTIASRPRDVALAASFCSDGFRLVTATDAEVAGLLAAAQPVVDRVAKDAVAGPVLAAVRSAAGAPAADTLPTCVGRSTAPTTTLAPAAGDLPNGVYRFEVTDQAQQEADVPPGDWTYNRGVMTYTLKDGHFSFTQDPVAPVAEFQTIPNGTYTVNGDTVVFTFMFDHDAEKPDVVTLRWTLGADRSLRFQYVGGDPQWKNYDIADLTSAPWQRIGDA